MLSIFEVIVGAGKVIGYGKAVKNVTDIVSENSAQKRKERDLNRRVNEIANRNLFQTLVMYVMAAGVGGFLSSSGILGFVVVLLFFFTHCSGLYELSRYINVKREIILSVLLALVFLFCFLGG